jgi:asparagine synthase (glutamine-hydrolysing)
VKVVARRYLPEKIVGRRKAGFAVPVTDWLRPGGPLADYLDVLTEPRARDRGFLDAAEVRAVVDEHRRAVRDHGELLWALVNLELWHRVMLDNPDAAQGFGEPVAGVAAVGGARGA